MYHKCVSFFPALGLLGLILFGDCKPAKSGDDPAKFEIDFSPFAKAAGTLDCKITFTSKVAKEEFKRGLTIRGPVAEHTAEDLTVALKMLFEAEGWEVKEMGKTKLVVIGKKGRRVQELEMRAEGLAKEFHPVVGRTTGDK